MTTSIVFSAAALVLAYQPLHSPLHTPTTARTTVHASLTVKVGSIAELGDALHECAAPTPRAAADQNQLWWRCATLLSDALSELAAEGATQTDRQGQLDLELEAALDGGFGPPSTGAALDEVRQLCVDVLDRLKRESPSVYAVAKFSLKRNEALRTRRGVERCLAELGLLLGTVGALDKAEAEELLRSARPLTRSVSTSGRIGSLLVLCRGFWSPGVGASRGWRRGDGTVQQLLSGWAAPEPTLDQLLASQPEEMQRHSQLLRATVPFLHVPLQVWLSGLKPEERPEAAMAGRGAGTLALRLLGGDGGSGGGCGVAAGEELLRALQAWAVESVLLSVDAAGGGGGGGGQHEPSGAVLARTHGSEVALVLIASHAALVKGGKRQQRRWLEAVDRLGHAVWLMVEATEAEDAEDGGAVEAEGAEEAKVRTRRAIESVRALMLACSVLERSDELRPRYRAAFTRAHTTSAYVLSLLGEELASSISDDLAPATLAAALSRLVGWRRPELLFKYVALHEGERGDPRVASLARRWLRAVLGFGDGGGGGDGGGEGEGGGGFESVAQLRLLDPHNRRHLDTLAATGGRARRAVRLWRLADATGAQGGGGGEGEGGKEGGGARRSVSGGGAAGGVCGAEELFMAGEEMHTCLRVDAKCTRENRALLCHLTQPNARMLVLRSTDDADSGDGSGEDDGGRGRGHGGHGGGGGRGRTLARATVRLLGRADTRAPLLLLDQPLYAGLVEPAVQAQLEMRLLRQARDMAEALGVPLLLWRQCIGPALLAGANNAAAGDGGGGGDGEIVESKGGQSPPPAEGRVEVVEFGGVAPFVYSNLNGLVERDEEGGPVVYAHTDLCNFEKPDC